MSGKLLEKRVSFLKIGGPLGHFRIYLDTGIPPKMRRALFRSLFRHNKEWFRYFKTLQFKNLDQVTYDPFHSEQRGFPAFKFEGIETSEGRLGFEIQLRRLNLGLTQVELARRTRVAASYISLIERGLVRIRPLMLKRLWEATEPG